MAHATPPARTARSTSDRDIPASAPVRHRTPADADLQFPGCRPVRLRRDDLANFDGRLEYWEARTETAWVLKEPTGGIHESTSRRLPELARLIATVRGAPIRSFGSVDLLRVLGDRERAAGRAEGRTVGRAEGRTAGRADGQAELVRAMLRERGIAVSESFTARAAAAVDTPRGARMAAAALACTGEGDFWRRLDRP